MSKIVEALRRLIGIAQLAYDNGLVDDSLASELRSARAALAAHDAQPAPAAFTLRDKLQDDCVKMGLYWRAPDAHGVDCNVEQAAGLLANALGVEVNIRAQPVPAAPQEPAACGWSQDGEDSDTWQTGCGRYFRLDDGDPNDNRMYHCCFCGKPIDCNPYITEEETP